MAATMTYDSLVEDIMEYTERTDGEFIAQIPRLILLAENRIAAALKTLWETTVVNTTLSPGQTVLAKPVRWRKTLSVKIGESTAIPGQPVYLRDQNFVALYNDESDSAKPEYYSDFDYENWMFGPEPDRTYNIQITYNGKVTPLDTQNQVNLITTECPQLLLYACLIEANSYLKSVEKLQIWQSMYQSELQALTGEDDSRLIDKNAKIIQSQG